MNLLWFIVLFVMCSILVITTYESFMNRRRAKQMDEICKAARKINEQYRQERLKM